MRGGRPAELAAVEPEGVGVSMRALEPSAAAAREDAAGVVGVRPDCSRSGAGAGAGGEALASDATGVVGGVGRSGVVVRMGVGGRATIASGGCASSVGVVDALAVDSLAFAASAASKCTMLPVLVSLEGFDPVELTRPATGLAGLGCVSADETYRETHNLGEE